MSKMTSILVVDDDPAIRQVYTEILRTEGYEVWEATTGLEGLQMTRERRPDLVLLDVMLPDLSGIEVCRRIKADVALPDVFVVLFSGMATGTDQKVDGLTAGADDYIARPVASHEFLARIRLNLRLGPPRHPSGPANSITASWSNSCPMHLSCLTWKAGCSRSTRRP